MRLFKRGDKVTYKPNVSWLNSEHDAIKKLIKNKYLIVYSYRYENRFFQCSDGYHWTPEDFIFYKRKTLKSKLP